MSGLIDHEGKPLVLEAEPNAYTVEGICIRSPSTPQEHLRSALHESQKMVAQSVYLQARRGGADEMVAQSDAATAAAGIKSPFQIEPCAEAVFMLLAKEVAWRDKIILNLAGRLEALDGQKAPEKPEPPADPELN